VVEVLGIGELEIIAMTVEIHNVLIIAVLAFIAGYITGSIIVWRKCLRRRMDDWENK
jgi:hypothetical protein